MQWSKRPILFYVLASVLVAAFFLPPLWGHRSRLFYDVYADHWGAWLSKEAMYHWFIGIASLIFGLGGVRFLAEALRSKHITKAVVCGLSITGLIAAALFSASYLGQKYYHTYHLKKASITLSNMKSLATLWMMYFEDHRTYCPQDARVRTFHWGNISADELIKMLFLPHAKKETIRKLMTDGWGNSLQFGVAGSEDCDTGSIPCIFGIRSAAGDGQWQADRYLEWVIMLDDHDSDLLICSDFWGNHLNNGPQKAGPIPIAPHITNARVFPYLSQEQKKRK